MTPPVARRQEKEVNEGRKWRRLLRQVWPEVTHELDMINQYLEAAQAARPARVVSEQDAANRAGRMLWT